MADDEEVAPLGDQGGARGRAPEKAARRGGRMVRATVLIVIAGVLASCSPSAEQVYERQAWCMVDRWAEYIDAMRVYEGSESDLDLRLANALYERLWVESRDWNLIEEPDRYRGTKDQLSAASDQSIAGRSTSAHFEAVVKYQAALLEAGITDPGDRCVD